MRTVKSDIIRTLQFRLKTSDLNLHITDFTISLNLFLHLSFNRRKQPDELFDFIPNFKCFYFIQDFQFKQLSLWIRKIFKILELRSIFYYLYSEDNKGNAFNGSQSSFSYEKINYPIRTIFAFTFFLQ